MILFFLPETLRCRVGNGRLSASQRLPLIPPTLSSPLAPEHERGPPPPKPTLRGYWRLFSYPPIGIVSLNTAVLYSSYFCIAVVLATDLPDAYGWSTAATGAAYIAVGVAIVAGSLAGGRVSDLRRSRAVTNLEKAAEAMRSGDDAASAAPGVPPPENRLVDQIWGVLLCAAGCAMYGWFIQNRIHPAATLAATFLGELFRVSLSRQRVPGRLIPH